MLILNAGGSRVNRWYSALMSPRDQSLCSTLSVSTRRHAGETGYLGCCRGSGGIRGLSWVHQAHNLSINSQLADPCLSVENEDPQDPLHPTVAFEEEVSLFCLLSGGVQHYFYAILLLPLGRGWSSNIIRGWCL